MSGYLMGRVLEHKWSAVPARPKLDPTARRGCSADTLMLVMLCVTNRANDDGSGTHPGVREIAEYAQRHTDTVVIALAHLRIDGFLIRETAQHRTLADNYVVNVANLVHSVRGSGAAHDGESVTPLSRARRAALEPRTTRGSGAALNVNTSIRPAADAAEFSSDDRCIDCGKPTGDRFKFRCTDHRREDRPA